MIAYRLTRRGYADLTGKGGLHASGRCHRRGTRIIYCSSSRALAVLEVLVHVDTDNLPLDYVMLEISLPEDIRFKRSTANGVLAESARPAFPVYVVPSAIIREENNIILFPGHAEFRAAIVSTTAFEFDDRLFKRRIR